MSKSILQPENVLNDEQKLFIIGNYPEFPVEEIAHCMGKPPSTIRQFIETVGLNQTDKPQTLNEAGFFNLERGMGSDYTWLI